MTDNVIELVFARRRDTKRTVLFDEQLGEQAWSDKDVAIGPLYVQKQALEMIGNPEKIDVIIKPHKEE
jgi:isocitrate/isopropylmalate dehydrogenase